MKLLYGKRVVFFYVLMATIVRINSALVNMSSTSTEPKHAKVAAIIVFGDSVVDPGNNDYIKTTVKCNFLPYGRDFIDGRPTGRFSNGKIPSDIIAQELGVKDLLPAYLDPSLQLQDLLTGVSFASGGSGYDPLTSKIVSVLSLSDQLEMFKEYLSKIKGAGVREEEMERLISESIYIICTGTDDIANTYFISPFRRNQFDINSYTDLLISSASRFYQELYGIGARRIGVFSLPPIGCMPSQRTLGGGTERQCSKDSNEAAMLFNSKLFSTIDSLNKKLPDFRLVYVDIYNPLLSLIQNHAQYGFEEVTRGCCGTGYIEAGELCNSLDDGITCSDASKYIFWDSYHPTERACQILVPSIINKDFHTLLT